MNTSMLLGMKTVFLGRYEAQRLLGEGGMGKVYLGRQLDQERSVVIKVMHSNIAANPRFRQNFAREMRLMTRFQHPNAVALYDASPADTTQPCIIMEYVPGITLEELLQRHGRLPALQVGRLLAQLCLVLQAAHDVAFLHRDLTLANIMVVNADTPEETIKVLDFGLARMGAAPFISLEKLSGTGSSIGSGTPDYLCPEQIRREEVDHRGDLYSVGIVLFKLLTGRLPFNAGRAVPKILLAHLENQPLTFTQAGVASEVPAGVEEVVQSCLRKDPRERPQSAREIAQRFDRALGRQFYPDHETAQPAAMPPVELEEPCRIKPAELMDCFEAWMPEQIAVVKLRGFVGDLGGEVVESEPGLIRVCMPGPKVTPPATKGFLAWLGLGPKPQGSDTVVMELHLKKKSAGDRNQLQITVAMRPEKNSPLANDSEWRPWCQRLCRDLRAYLISC